MSTSALKRTEECNAIETVHSFFEQQHSKKVGATFFRVIKLVSENLAQKDIEIRPDSMTDHELIFAVYKQILANMSTVRNKQSDAILKGVRRFNEVLENAGGVYSVSDVAELLKIKENTVRKRRERNQLLAVDYGKRSLYPVWQFAGDKVIPGLTEVLKALEGVSQVLKVQFLLGTDADYKSARIEYLQEHGADEDLLRKARQLGEQGAR